MTTKLFASILSCWILFPYPALAATSSPPHESPTKWNWIWSYTAYDQNDATFRSWGSTQSVVQFTIRNGQFKTHLIGKNGEPDFYITGSIHGDKVTAKILVNETDEPPRHCQGIFNSDFGAKRITFTSPNGDFIGFITQAPTKTSAHN
jgi:hypothetical protein